MASTKYPIHWIEFPWFTASDLASIPHAVYPNWRRAQRPPEGPHESDELKTHRRHAGIGGTTAAAMDFHHLKYLATITEPTLVLMDIQGYGAEKITTAMIILDKVYWCGGRPGDGLPRLDCHSVTGRPGEQYVLGKCEQHWGPLVLCIAPLRKDTPYFEPQVALKTEPLTTEIQSFQRRILDQYGLPKVA